MKTKKIAIIFFIISYIFVIKPVTNIIELKREIKLKLKKINDLTKENKNLNLNLKLKLKKYLKNENHLEDIDINYGIKTFENLGEYNSYINYHMRKNKIRILYIGRSIFKKNSVVVSYNLKGKLYNLISFLNEIEKDKKVFLSGENFYIEEKNHEIIATINLEGNILRD